MSVEGVVKLADFGLARVRTHGTASLTVEGEVKGTLPYLAPELIVGGRASERSDIYGLGAVLYELAVGEPPFAGANSYELIKKICEGQLDGPPLGEAAKAFPAEFHALVEEMLARRPEERPESALEVQLRLEACGASRRERRRLGAAVREIQGDLQTSAAAQVVLDGHEVAHKPEPSPPAGARPKKKSRRRLLAAVALISMVGLAGIVMGRAGGVEDVNEVERRAPDRIGALAEPSGVAPQPPRSRWQGARTSRTGGACLRTCWSGCGARFRSDDARWSGQRARGAHKTRTRALARLGGPVGQRLDRR